MVLVMLHIQNHYSLFKCLTSVFKIPGDDHQALIWDIQQMPRPIEDPILAYTAAEGAINQVNKTHKAKYKQKQNRKDYTIFK